MNSRRIAWVTSSLSVGAFASPERVKWLVEEGVTDILNVSDARSLAEAHAAGFRSVVFIPVADCVPIMEETLEECLAALDTMFARPGARVFVHCMAGQNRSPTIVWLYLLRLGWGEAAAREMVVANATDAIPGHPQLITPRLIDLARNWPRSI